MGGAYATGVTGACAAGARGALAFTATPGHIHGAMITQFWVVRYVLTRAMRTTCLGVVVEEPADPRPAQQAQRERADVRVETVRLHLVDRATLGAGHSHTTAATLISM